MKEPEVIVTLDDETGQPVLPLDSLLGIRVWKKEEWS